jgi:hypothetical protein
MYIRQLRAYYDRKQLPYSFPFQIDNVLRFSHFLLSLYQGQEFPDFSILPFVIPFLSSNVSDV